MLTAYSRLWVLQQLLQSGVLLVLQGVLENKADEIQVRGRVARKNQPGSYSLLLSWPDIADGLGNS